MPSGTPKRPVDPAQTLVLAPGALGDTVLRALAVRQLSASGVLPGPIRVVGTSTYLPVYRWLLPDARLESFDDRLWTSLFTYSADSLSGLCAALRGTEVAVAWLPEDEAATGRLRACGIRDVRWADPRNVRPGEHQLTALLRLAGQELEGDQLEVKLNESIEVTTGKPRILVHPGAGSPRKRLTTDVYRRVSEGLVRKGWGVTWLLGPVEEGASEIRSIARTFDSRFCSDVDELVGLLKQYSLVLGNDSGVEHLAAALGIPVISFFVSTDPTRWHAVGPLVVTVDLRSEEPQVRAFRGFSEVELEKVSLAPIKEVPDEILAVLGGEKRE